jgi:hypothetical protein
MALHTISAEAASGFREGRARAASAPGDDDFEVFARHDHRVVTGTVEPLDQCKQIIGQRRLRAGIER